MSNEIDVPDLPCKMVLKIEYFEIVYEILWKVEVMHSFHKSPPKDYILESCYFHISCRPHLLTASFSDCS